MTKKQNTGQVIYQPTATLHQKFWRQPGHFGTSYCRLVFINTRQPHYSTGMTSWSCSHSKAKNTLLSHETRHRRVHFPWWMLPQANRVIFSINKCQEHLPTFDVFRKSFIDLWAVQLVPMATSAQTAVLLYCGLIKRDGQTEFHSRFLLPCAGTETLLRVCQTECPFS